MTVNKKLICEKMCELLQLTEVGQQIKLKSIDYNPETGEVASRDRKSTRLNSSHPLSSRMPSSA